MKRRKQWLLLPAVLLALVLNSGLLTDTLRTGTVQEPRLCPQRLQKALLMRRERKKNPILVRRQMKKRKNSSGPILPEGKQM